MSLGRFQAFFHEAAGGSGYLDVDKLIEVFRRKGYRDEAKIRAMFRAISISAKERITLDEYLVALGEKPADLPKGWVMASCYFSFDKDHDKYIHSGDLTEVLKEMDRDYLIPKVGRIIEKADRNRDGKLDYVECFGKTPPRNFPQIGY